MTIASLVSTILNLGIDTYLVGEASCLLLLDDYHWRYILSKLSLVSKLNLSHTCRRFYELVNDDSRTIRCKQHAKKIYKSKLNVKFLIEGFCNNVQTKYYRYVVEKTDKVYIEFFFNILKLELTPEKILAHLLWCRRNYSFEDNCHYCSRVVRFYNETPVSYISSAYYNDLWNKEIEKVFYDELHFQNNKEKHLCFSEQFENIHSFPQLTNLLGVIAIRIFFNISKRFLFTVRLKQKEVLYGFFVSESKRIFPILYDNFNVRYLQEQIKLFEPFTDYDASFSKITNTYYLKYLEENVYESVFGCVKGGSEKR